LVDAIAMIDPELRDVAWSWMRPARLSGVAAHSWLALQETDVSDETFTCSLSCPPRAVIIMRAVIRAVGSAGSTAMPLAGTIGLWRPRVAIDRTLAAMLDEGEYVATFDSASSFV
jgi:hypothetical protein